MDEKILIIHGYSDGSESFNSLRDFLVKEIGFAKKHVFHSDYASMDDQANFRDFADKLDADYNRLFNKGERINVACHSTGSLVVRTWLALRRQRQLELGLKIDCPVKRILMFAPANFGSDLASMGQSVLGKLRSTFFNRFSFKREDFLESGKQVLQGLEPASPFQWGLSEMDLHGFDYFSAQEDENLTCYPFVFAAGYDYADELQSRIVKARKKSGTDGTVRICGTNLNTRKCTLSFLKSGRPATIKWHPEKKFNHIPFAVFHKLNHGSIIDSDKKNFNGLAPLIRSALKVSKIADYEKVAGQFAKISGQNYTKASGRYQDVYQQFFFKARDDVDRPIEDYFVHFTLEKTRSTFSNKKLNEISEQLEQELIKKFYRHSADASCRVLMIKLNKLNQIKALLDENKLKLVMEINATNPLPNISYAPGKFVVYDGSSTQSLNGNPSFLFPNTTTLVDLIFNRKQTDKLLHLKDHDLKKI